MKTHLLARKLSTLLGVIAAIVFVVATPAQADAPVRGDMDLGFNLAASGPSDVVPTWVGTVTIDEVPYGMAFFNLGTGKPFADQPAPQATNFYGERWVIYDVGTGVMDPAGFVPGSIVLAGTDEGVGSLVNGKYRMNGSVDEAHGVFSMLLGRPVHMQGVIEFYPFGAPRFAPGTFRVN